VWQAAVRSGRASAGTSPPLGAAGTARATAAVPTVRLPCTPLKELGPGRGNAQRGWPGRLWCARKGVVVLLFLHRTVIRTLSGSLLRFLRPLHGGEFGSLLPARGLASRPLLPGFGCPCVFVCCFCCWCGVVVGCWEGLGRSLRSLEVEPEGLTRSLRPGGRVREAPRALVERKPEESKAPIVRSLASDSMAFPLMDLPSGCAVQW
jgi:hypothetical protein